MYEKFLGQMDYNQKFLLPFETFLHASFCKYFKSNDCNINLLYSYVAAQDCTGRSLVQPEEAMEGMASETEMSDSEKQNEAPVEGGKEQKDNSHDCSGDDDDDEKGTKTVGKSQYEKDKERNVAQLQNILEDIKEKHPVPVELAGKESKKQAVKKKGEKVEPVVRRESQRAKDKIRCLANVMINAFDADISSAVLLPFLMLSPRRPFHLLRLWTPPQLVPLQLLSTWLVSKIPQPKTLHLRQQTLSTMLHLMLSKLCSQ